MILDSLEGKIKDKVPDIMAALDIIKEVDTALEKARTENVNEMISETLPAIQEKEQIKAIIKVRDENRIATGKAVFALSPFNSEMITVNENELYPNIFIPDKSFNDPASEETKLYPDIENDRWLVRVKNGLPKLNSRFVVVGCLIVMPAVLECAKLLPRMLSVPATPV